MSGLSGLYAGGGIYNCGMSNSDKKDDRFPKSFWEHVVLALDPATCCYYWFIVGLIFIAIVVLLGIFWPK